MWNEKGTENTILEFLSYYGFVVKHNQSGRPVKKGNSAVLIPFKHNYWPCGIPDIQFVENYHTYFFEVKSPAKIKRFYNKQYGGKLKGDETFESYLEKSHPVEYNQFTFMKRVMAMNQHYSCGFVSSLKSVKAIIKDKPWPLVTLDYGILP